ncbi:MAG TPA: hypothetical protein VIC00_02665, partial [Candidatus Acidoferrales bacterium]
KIGYVFVLACLFDLSWLLGIFPPQHDELTLFLLLAISPFLPIRPSWMRKAWWPAMRRSLRRARGGWSEDEERFVAEMSRPKK